MGQHSSGLGKGTRADIHPTPIVGGGIVDNLSSAHHRAAIEVDVHTATPLVGAVADDLPPTHRKPGTRLVDSHPTAGRTGGVAKDLPLKQGRAALIHVHPTAMKVGNVVSHHTVTGLSESSSGIVGGHPTARTAGGVTEDLPPAQRRTAPVYVHPAAAVTSGVADDLCSVQQQVACVDVHTTTPAIRHGAGGNVAADDGVDECQVGVVVVDTATQAGDVAVHDRHARDNNRARAEADIQNPVRDEAAGVNDRLARSGSLNDQCIGDVQVAGGGRVLARTGDGQTKSAEA